MISNCDYKIEIKFDQYNKPYYKMFRKDEPYTIQPEDYRELAVVFSDLAFKTKTKADEEDRTARIMAAKGDIKNMDVNAARRLLSYEGKRLWVDIHNAMTGGHGYRLAANGDIEDVPMAGVWK